MQTVKFGFSVGLVMVFALSCSDGAKQSAASCLPGETRACLGPGQCKGVQTCAADGRSLSACACHTESELPAAGSSSTRTEQAGSGMGGRSDSVRLPPDATSIGGAGGATGVDPGSGTTFGGSNTVTSHTGFGISGSSYGGLTGATISGGTSNAGASSSAANVAGTTSTVSKTVAGTPGSFLQHVWSYGFGPGVGAQVLAIGPDQSIYVLGGVDNTYGHQGVLLKLASNGRHVWEVHFNEKDARSIMSVDAAGRLIVQQTLVSYLTTQFNIDTGWLCGAELPSQSFTTSYVAALNADGRCVWAQSFASRYALLTPAGDLVVGTTASTQLLKWNDRATIWGDTSGAVLAATAPNADLIAVAQGTELEIRRLEASTGVALWRKSTLGKLWVSSAPYDVVPRWGAIRFRADGSMVWSDLAQGNSALWGLAVPGRMTDSVPFVISLTAQGDFVWGIATPDSQIRVAVAKNGDSVICGTFKDVIAFMGQELRVPGEITTSDVYLALIGPTGELKRLEQWRLADNQTCADLAFDQNDDLVILGQYNGTLDFGGGELPQGNSMMYMAKFRIAE